MPPSAVRRALLALAVMLPAVAATHFEPAPLTRSSVPPGTGLCEIRIAADGALDVSIRATRVTLHNKTARDSHDSGSQCSGPLPSGDVAGFRFAVLEGGDLVRLTAEPTHANRGTAAVAINSESGATARYTFRLTWSLSESDPSAPPGFSRNNSLVLHADGSGSATLDLGAPTLLTSAAIEIDDAGKMVALFRTSAHATAYRLSGQVLSTEGERWKADVVTEDRRLRGTLWLSLNPARQLLGLTLDATDGQQHLHLEWVSAKAKRNAR